MKGQYVCFLMIPHVVWLVFIWDIYLQICFPTPHSQNCSFLGSIKWTLFWPNFVSYSYLPSHFVTDTLKWSVFYSSKLGVDSLIYWGLMKQLFLISTSHRLCQRSCFWQDSQVSNLTGYFHRALIFYSLSLHCQLMNLADQFFSYFKECDGFELLLSYYYCTSIFYSSL